jgi:hypothetical protein
VRVSFGDARLARLCNSVNALSARYGSTAAARIVLLRLCQLDAVADLGQAMTLPGASIAQDGRDAVVSFPRDRLTFTGIVEPCHQSGDGSHTAFVIVKLGISDRVTERSAR